MARANWDSCSRDKNPTVRPNRRAGMVVTLSTDAAHSWSRPFARPRSTSLDSPLIVEVTGATVTFVMTPRAASRVRTTTGRVLSRRARRISRTSAVDLEVAGRPLHQRIQVVLRACAPQSFRVALGVHAAHLPL